MSISGLTAAGLVDQPGTGADQATLRLTPAGEAAVARLADARRQGLTDLLEGWDLDSNQEVVDMVTNLANALMADDGKMLAAAGLHASV